MSNMIFTAIGVGVGLVLLILAGLSFWTAAQWAAIDREPATIGYVLTGVFLVIAGLGGIIGSWYHNFRVVTAPPKHHH